MTTIAKIILGALVLIVGFLLFTRSDKTVVQNPPTNNQPVVTQSQIEGCYVQKLAKDVYTLNVQEENNGAITGTLKFDNFEKDSSSGTFMATYKDEVLLGDYAFASEGTNSIMEVAFKKSGDNFVRGFGEVDVKGDTVTFQDITKITFDPKDTFMKVSCAEI